MSDVRTDVTANQMSLGVSCCMGNFIVFIFTNEDLLKVLNKDLIGYILDNVRLKKRLLKILTRNSSITFYVMITKL